MLQWIIGSSIKNRVLVTAAATALLATGIARLPDATVGALPDFGPVRAEVQTEALQRIDTEKAKGSLGSRWSLKKGA